jgi:hypothetical protein
MRTSELREKIGAALTDVSAAEQTLEDALRALQTAPRAEKVVVTEVVASAFERLRAARKVLTALRVDVGDGPDEDEA